MKVEEWKQGDAREYVVMFQQHWRREWGEIAERLLELVILWTRPLFDLGTFAVLLVTNLDMDLDVCIERGDPRPDHNTCRR